MADQNVILRFPASSERVRLARTVAAVLGDEAGFDYDEVEDLRIGVDELCFALLERSGSAAVIELTADAQPGEITIEGIVVGETSSPATADSPSEITRQILATVLDDYELELDGDNPRFRLVKHKP